MGCDMKKTVFLVILVGIIMLSGCSKTDKKDGSITSSISSSEATKLELSSQHDSSSQVDSSINVSNEAEIAYWSTFYGCDGAIDVEKKRLQAEKDFGDGKISHADIRNIMDKCMKEYDTITIINEKRIRAEISGDNLATFNSYLIEREKADKLKIQAQKKLEQYANIYGYVYGSQLEFVEYEIAKSKAVEMSTFLDMVLAKKEAEKLLKPNT